MEREAAKAAYEALHTELKWHDGTFTSWTKERDAAHSYPFGKAETIGVAEDDLTPWDQFMTDPEASPLHPDDLARLKAHWEALGQEWIEVEEQHEEPVEDDE